MNGAECGWCGGCNHSESDCPTHKEREKEREEREIDRAIKRLIDAGYSVSKPESGEKE